MSCIDVGDFGAAGDGVTDVTAAAGAPVYAPSGTYLVTTLDLNGDLSILGDGGAKTTFKTPDGANPQFMLRNPCTTNRGLFPPGPAPLWQPRE